MDRIAILEYGSMRSFIKKLSNDISLFENNIIQFKKFINDSDKFIIDLYILTEIVDELDENVASIKDILIRNNINLIQISFWDNIKNDYLELDNIAYNSYIDICDVKNYRGSLYGFDNKLNYNAGNMWFRRYVNYKIFEEYADSMNLDKHTKE